MTPEQFATWIVENRRARLRRQQQWTCSCSSRSDVFAVVYQDMLTGGTLLWHLGKQSLLQDGRIAAARPRGFHLQHMISTGSQLMETAQCRNCRDTWLLLLDGEDLTVRRLGPATRATVQ